MATTYTSTIEVNVWKEHICSCCGGAYRYLFKRKKQGQGSSPDAARAAAHAAVVKALTYEVDMHPCPTCGLYQPDMIGSWRAKRHGWITALAVTVILVPLILYLCDVMTARGAAWTGGIIAAISVLLHWAVDAVNHNRNLESNQQASQLRHERGDIWVPRNAKPSPDRDEAAATPYWSSSHTTTYIMMLLGVLAFLSPELVRMVSRWPANPDWVPMVAGPGDQPYVYFPEKITAVKGFWRGTPQITVRNYQELGLKAPQIQGQSQADSWGQQIQIGSKESKTSSKTLWARVLLPPDPQLEGKVLDLQIDLVVNYPQLQGANQWIEEHFQPRSLQQKLQLASAGAGSKYKGWWWGGFFTGVFLMLVPGIALTRISSGMRNQANPTGIFAPGEGEEEAEDQAAPAEESRLRPGEQGDDRITQGEGD